MKRRVLLLPAALLLLAAALLSLRQPAAPRRFDEERDAVLVRQLGHELLRLSGDSTTRVPPVARPEAGRYVLSFAAPLSFVPDSLVAHAGRLLRAHAPERAFVVSVIGRPSGSIVFGFSLGQPGRDDLVPCIGRQYPEGLYDVAVQFADEPPPVNGRLAGAAVAGLGLLLALAAFRRPRSKPTAEPASIPAQAPPEASEDTPPLPAEAEERLALGRYRFVPAQQCLLLGDERIELTDTESRLLHRFAVKPNELIERQHLQKIWEDDGVIVGRSLDVFVSRLRKKLEKDPALALVNVPRKGYRLEIGRLSEPFGS